MFESLTKGGGDWNQFLYLTAGIQIAAGVFCALLNPNRPAIRE